jgi:hypothetical protein
VTVHTGAAESEPPADGTESRDGNGPTADELGAFWFVAFDGGGEDGMACALVAEEVSAGVYHGAWTYEPALVRAFTAYLDGTDGAEDAERPSADSESGAADEPTDADERTGSSEHNG